MKNFIILCSMLNFYQYVLKNTAFILYHKLFLLMMAENVGPDKDKESLRSSL